MKLPKPQSSSQALIITCPIAVVFNARIPPGRKLELSLLCQPSLCLPFVRAPAS